MKRWFPWCLVGVLALASIGRAAALEPFVAQYQVFNAGKRLGEATMQVARDGGGRWRIAMDMRGTRGLAGLAGANAHQSTVFDIVGETYRPLSQSTVRKAAFRGKRATGLYDWDRHVATWSGDVKPDRSGPIDLQSGDLDALLINLALVRDLEGRRPLRYRMVDDGRIKQLRYDIAGKETITIEGKPRQATRLVFSQDDRQTLVWVVEGVPVPARILQKDKGADASDLRLAQVR